MNLISTELYQRLTGCATWATLKIVLIDFLIDWWREHAATFLAIASMSSRFLSVPVRLVRHVIYSRVEYNCIMSGHGMVSESIISLKRNILLSVMNSQTVDRTEDDAAETKR